MAQWIVLAAHGQWFVCWNPIRVIGRAMKGIIPQLLPNLSQDPAGVSIDYIWGFPCILWKTDDWPNLGNIRLKTWR